MKRHMRLLGRYSSYLLISIVPMLLGWGVDDLAGFFRNPARAVYAGLVVVVGLAIFVPHLDVSPFGQGRRVVGRGLLRAYMSTGFAILIFLPFGDRRGLLTFTDCEALRWVGIVLTVVGTTIRVAGIWSLGKQVSSHVTIQENHQLVQTGMYRHLRNPMYLGFLIMNTSLVVIFRSWLVFPFFVWTLVFVLVRIGQEERLLGEHFGSEYESYIRRTWRLVPYVY